MFFFFLTHAPLAIPQQAFRHLPIAPIFPLLFLLIAWSSSTLCVAETKHTYSSSPTQLPLWELGFGIGFASLPGYIGSKYQDSYTLPFPTFFYRGETWKVSRQAVDAVFVDNDRIEIKLSFNGSPPVRSDDNEARIGMHDLDATLEIGPSMLIHFPFILPGLGEIEHHFVELELPVRSVLASDGSYIDDQGYTFNPKIRMRRYDAFANTLIRSSLTVAAVYGSHRYFDYFYGVDQPDVRADRALYNGSSGLGGYYTSVGVSIQQRHWRLGFYARYQNISDSVYSDSPLLEKHTATMFGFYLNRTFRQSDIYVLATE